MNSYHLAGMLVIFIEYILFVEQLQRRGEGWAHEKHCFTDSIDILLIFRLKFEAFSLNKHWNKRLLFNFFNNVAVLPNT